MLNSMCLIIMCQWYDCLCPFCSLPFPLLCVKCDSLTGSYCPCLTSSDFDFPLSCVFTFTCFPLFIICYSFFSTKPVHNIQTDLQLKLVLDIFCFEGVFLFKLSSFHLKWTWFSDGTPVLFSDWYRNFLVSRRLQKGFLFSCGHNMSSRNLLF